MAGAILFNTSSSNSLNSALGIGLSAITAARLVLQTTGHNIANVNTPGYSRQMVDLSARDPQITNVGALGRGVDVIRIAALRDNFIEAQLAIESQEFGRLEMRDNLLGRLESIFNPTQALGLPEVTDNLFGAFQDLASNPENLAQREALMAEADAMATASNHTVTQLKGLKRSINDDIRATLGGINSILEEIATLNVSLAGADQLGRSLEDLRDERNLRFRELNELISIQGFENEDSALTITTANGSPLVIGNQYTTLTAEVNPLDPTVFDVISTFNNVPTNITPQISGGRLGGLLEIRDQVVEGAISNQHLFAAILADSVNIEHRLGTDLNGNAGGNFFRDPFEIGDNSVGANVDNVVQVGDNATFEINYSIVPNAVSGVSITDINLDTANLNALTKHDYSIRFNGPAAGDYEVVDNATAAIVTTGNLPGAGTITFEGLSVDFDGQPAIGDKYDLSFDGRVGMTGDIYSIEWTSATDYEIYNLSTRDPNPTATGTLAGNGMIFFDGLAVQVSGARIAGDSFKIDYNQMSLDPNITPVTIAASGSAPGLAEPGNNENALRIGDLALKSLGGFGDRNFTLFQSSQIAGIGNEKASNSVLFNAQGNFVSSLEIQRESVSGVSLDEEAADLVQFQQGYTAAARYLSTVNDLMDFLISVLGG